MLGEIQRLVEAADFDEALRSMSTLSREELAGAIRREAQAIDRIRFGCMASDLFDYAGRFPDAAFYVGIVGVEARRVVELFLDNSRVENYRSPIAEARLVKQCCWALIHVATSDYRVDKYGEALSLLDGLVRKGLEGLERQKAKAEESAKVAERLAYQSFGVEGTQSRLWYGIGLIRRQRREERFAREAFTRSIIYASQGVESHAARGKNTAFYDYSVGKAMGLGLGWISYSEARLSESLAELVAARRLLAAARGASFIQSYIDVIYSRALLSAYADIPGRVEEAINTLKRGRERLSHHGLYRHRADYAMALSLVNRFLIQKQNGSSEGAEVTAQDLDTVRQTIDGVKSAGWLAKYDRATLCNFLVLESRIWRIQEDYDKALGAATEALRLGNSIDFVRVDCLICLGEAFFYKQDYSTAMEHFRKAYDAAQGSRKLRAAAELHLARTCLASGKRPEAREYFQRWKNASAGAENVFIRNLGSDLESQLNDFIVDADVESLLAEKHVANLRRWLAVEGMRRWGKLNREYRERQFREQMGVDAKTIDRWLKLKN